jgi:hypothetical protein
MCRDKLSKNPITPIGLWDTGGERWLPIGKIRIRFNSPRNRFGGP